MRVLAAYRDNAANYYRTQCPFQVLKYKGLDVEIRGITLDDAEDFDVLWLQMHAEPIADIVAHEFKEKGKKVVYDVDDFLFAIPPSWPSYGQFFEYGTGLPKERLLLHERCIEMADLVTCTTPYLEAKLKERFEGIKTAVLPNCVLMGDWDILPDVGHSQDGPVLGWFGTANHWDDWREISGAVESALAEQHGYLAFLGAPEIVMCFSNWLKSRTMVNSLVPIKKFDTIRQLIKGCDVGIAWATSTLEISQCRSPLKAFQWGAAGVPVVASETIYGGLSDHICTTKPYDLFKNLSSELSLAGKERKADYGSKWQSEVFNSHSYETQSNLWLKAIEDLCSK